MNTLVYLSSPSFLYPIAVSLAKLVRLRIRFATSRRRRADENRCPTVERPLTGRDVLTNVSLP